VTPAIQGNQFGDSLPQTPKLVLVPSPLFLYLERLQHHVPVLLLAVLLLRLPAYRCLHFSLHDRSCLFSLRPSKFRLSITMRFSTISMNRRLSTTILLLNILCGICFAIGPLEHGGRPLQRPLGPGRIDPIIKQNPLSESQKDHTLPAFLDALDVLQQEFFEIWQGIWPASIDWTSAVIGTFVSSALTTLSTSYSSLESAKEAENLVNKYFSQLIGSYFGQDAFALRQEAYDDMLWVVLGWLETIKFINAHSALHYNSTSSSTQDGSWYGTQYIPAFAHRARLFWDMASQGWDTKLCNGGMIWSPYLTPYKNAITNELYIAASISMYLYFPGDENTSPFGLAKPDLNGVPIARPHDPKYLAAAIEAYKWLNGSNMTDAKGLYVDGFHVSGWSRERPKNSTGNTRCDARNEMVYTYNQGVLLSGQRGLYEATGARSYLEDGHKLVEDVIKATGWNVRRNIAPKSKEGSKLGKWHGIGRSGVLEEACDAPGYCSQDAQTFKGIFFHHLTLFCSRLPEHLVLPGGYFLGKDFDDDKKYHSERCQHYGAWIKHNAQAALGTKDREGKFGMWWGAPKHADGDDFDVHLPDQAVDYRNQGVPPQWKNTRKYSRDDNGGKGNFESTSLGVGITDLNDRGRGRTVETQGGAVALLRAAWEVVGRN
jgi:hypothetical protein